MRSRVEDPAVLTDTSPHHHGLNANVNLKKVAGKRSEEHRSFRCASMKRGKDRED